VIKNGQKEVFRLGNIKSEMLRTNLEVSLQKAATQEVSLGLREGKSQEGDPENRLIEISFENGAGKTEDERRNDLLSKLWGSSDSVVGVKHTAEVLAASKRAREKLAGLRASFEKGLPPGSRLIVKAPFARDDEGKEWMWVEVTKWPISRRLEGLLQNDPFYIRKLRAGTRVQVNVDEIFDYILYREDGTEEGNETGELMQKQAGPSKSK
jgi:uncharacterized protein YegJ (DUF2314 family)